jgi:hypothetical protein
MKKFEKINENDELDFSDLADNLELLSNDLNFIK